MSSPEPAVAVVGRLDLTQRTFALLERLSTVAAEADLPQPPDELRQAHSKLAEGTYKILVVGEVKRGKSTFINALIGRDVLPTDVDVATSQIFKVSRGPESYRLRFENDSLLDISRADLPRHGSQVVLDGEGRPRLDQTIRWIEVHVPARFLPPSVEILDTPGLGALYASHTQITQRFLPHADAVIFVLDSGQPIVQAELDLLGRILKVTSHVFFIQTKIDQYSKEEWAEILARNEEILRERFGGRLGDTRIWPISSKNLRTAAESDHPDALLMVSRYKELADELQQFLAGVSSAPRIAQALALASHYHASCRELLAGRLSMLSADSYDEAAQRLKSMNDERQYFAANWGRGGRRRTELTAEAKRVLSVNRQAFHEAFQSGGAVVTSIENRIETATTLTGLNEMGEKLSDDLIEAAMDEWRATRVRSEKRLGELLATFFHAADHRGPRGVGDDATPITIDRRFESADLSAFDRLQGTYAGAAAPLMLATFLGLGPIGLIGAVWGVSHMWKKQTKAQVASLRNELIKLLRGRLQELHQHFFAVNASGEAFSRVDEYFNSLERSFGEFVNTSVRQRVEDADAELKRLHEQSALHAKERAEETARVRAQLADWDAFVPGISKLVELPEVAAAVADLRSRVPALAEPPSAEVPAVVRS